MKLFYECSFFKEDFEEKQYFTVKQNELILKEQISQEKFSYDNMEVEYICFWEKQLDWDSGKPTILIPIRDHLELISKTIKNLKEKNIKVYQ